MRTIQKKQRQKLLNNLIEKKPFLTDKELSEQFNVSIQTIRLDRMELGIPEVRERTKDMAHTAYKQFQSVAEGEVIGDLVELELDKYAESFLKTTKEMILQGTSIIRGHYIFAQANSLAVATINSDIVLTGKAVAEYLRPAYVGDILRAKSNLKDIERENDKYLIEVNTYKNDSKVFEGEFVMFARSE
jgi:acyl-coenzyme A thioesterase PaaI-like protein